MYHLAESIIEWHCTYILSNSGITKTLLESCVSVEDWPIERKLEECEGLCRHSTTAARKGCKMPPLLTIPFQFVVVDTLHMFLRIMGWLFNEVNIKFSFRAYHFVTL